MLDGSLRCFTMALSDAPLLEDAQSAPAAREPSAMRKWVIAFSVILCALLEVLDSSIVNVALPHMQGSFSASVDEVTWVVTTYLVAAGIMIPTTGWIARRWGRKRYFLISVWAFVITSMMCGLAQSLNQIVVFRLFQGFAGAAMQPLSQAILMETFPPEEQTLAMAVWGVGLLAAPIMGPTVGGYITDNWNWRWNFYINVPLGMFAAFMVSTFVSDPPYMKKFLGKGRADYLGIACLVVSLGLGELVMDRGERANWFSAPWVIYSTAIALGAFIWLIVHECRTDDPVIRVRILATRTFAVPTVLLIVLTFASHGMQILNPIFLQELLGYTAMQAGLAMAPRGLGVMISMFFVGSIARHNFKTRPLVIVGILLLALGTWNLASLNLSMSIYNFVWATFIQGIGLGLVFPDISATALGSVSREEMGHAASLFSMTRNIGGSIGTSVLTTLLVRREQVRQGYLVGHISVFDAWRVSKAPVHMPGAIHFNFLRQLVTGQKLGLRLFYLQVQNQAMMLALNDIYGLVCGVVLVSTLLCLLLPARVPRLRVDEMTH